MIVVGTWTFSAKPVQLTFQKIKEGFSCVESLEIGLNRKLIRSDFSISWSVGALGFRTSTYAHCARSAKLTL